MRKAYFLILLIMVIIPVIIPKGQAAGSEWWEYTRFESAPTMSYFDNNNSIRIDYALTADIMEYYFHDLWITTTITKRTDLGSMVTVYIYWMKWWNGGLDNDTNPWNGEFPSIPTNASFTIGNQWNMTGSWGPVTESNSLMKLYKVNFTSGDSVVSAWNETNGIDQQYITAEYSISSQIHAGVNRILDDPEDQARYQGCGVLDMSAGDLAETVIITYDDNATVYVPVIDYEYVIDWFSTALLSFGAAVVVVLMGYGVTKFQAVAGPAQKYLVKPGVERSVGELTKLFRR